MSLRFVRPLRSAGVALSAVAIVCAAHAQTSQIQAIVSAGTLNGMRWPKFASYQQQAREFYEPSGYAPAWIKDHGPSPQALALIGLFRDAWRKGLDPEDYDASRWDPRLKQLSSGASEQANFDVALTVSAMRYISDLRIGRINPKHVKFDLDVASKKYDLAEFVQNRIAHAADINAAMAGVEPSFATYRRTEEALAAYRDLASKDHAEKLPVPKKAVEPGEAYDGVPRLASLLKLVGDLPADTQIQNPTIYDANLAEAVKRFQRRHGLEADGRLGAETVKQMNVPLADRVKQLQLTLERWRWLPTEFSAPPIVVNIPDFRLRALDDQNQVAMEMRVVAGKAMKTQTPVFSRDMTFVVLRPYWNVPLGILRRSVIPAIRRNRSEVTKKNYEITTPDGELVTAGAVTDDEMAQLEAGKLAVRQRPGPTNALGLVKLMFPNEYSVYLHSTPSTELFSRSRRDFSAGCIRVEKPAELTAWVLRNNPDWNLDKVRQAMESGNDNVTVKLDRPVPVFIVYGTAIANADGEVHFYNDIYGHDAKLAEALVRGYSGQ